MTSLSLLTPDLVREFCSKDSNERQFMKNQLEVWQDLQSLSQAGKLTLPMDIKRSGQPQDIPIELDLCAFNFGVNQGAFLKGASNVIGGWAGVENMNKVALEKINNRVDAHLKQGDKIIEELPTLITEEFTKLIEEIYTLVDDKHIVKKDVGSEKIEEFISTWPKGIKEIKGIFKNPLSQEPDKLKAFESDLSGLQTILENIKKSSKDSKVKDKFELVLESVGKIKNTLESVQKLVLIRKLARQINQIWQEKSYQSMGNEPYKMPSRLALLTYWLDGVAMWNCRSGKDRTGMLDAEAKFLAFYVHTFGDIPEPDTLLSEELNYMKQQFLLNSGNLEMQALNTGGLEGYKTEGVPAIDPLRNRPIFPAYRTGLSSQARG